MPESGDEYREVQKTSPEDQGGKEYGLVKDDPNRRK